MELFDRNGHLTEEALAALIRERELDELGRLEAAEHLAFCDLCLQRYMDALAGAELLTPERSCRESLWVRIRMRTVRLVTSRYATAAAAVALAPDGGLGQRTDRPGAPAGAAGGPALRLPGAAGMAGEVEHCPGQRHVRAERFF